MVPHACIAIYLLSVKRIFNHCVVDLRGFRLNTLEVIIMKKTPLDRRTLLKGAGFGLSLPLLDAMLPSVASAAPSNTKLAFVYFPHGAVMKYWTPKEIGTNFEYSPILKPLESIHEYVTVVSGLRNKGGESTNPHGIIEETWLTCVSPEQRRLGRDLSVDQIAAQNFTNTPLPSLELCGEPGGSISYRAGDRPLPLEGNPRRVYYTMFGEGDNYEDRINILQQKNSLLDYVMESTRSLNKKLGAGDKIKVEQYLDSVREIEQRIGKLEQSAQGLTGLPESPIGPPDDFEELMKIQYEMMALALQTGQTRVVSMRTVKEASMRVFSHLGIEEAFHPLSHHQEREEKYQQLVLIQKWQTQLVADFAARLKEMNLLDDTLILFGSNMSNSDLHNNNPLPSVLIGKGGGVKGGQHLMYAKDTPYANLLHTMLLRSGIETPSFADSTGPFTEV